MKKRLTFIAAFLVFLTLLAPAGVFAGGGSQQGRQSSETSVSPDNFIASGVRVVKEPVTKRYLIRRVPMNTEAPNMIVFQKYEEMTGIKVNWDIVTADGFEERINLLMASSSMPDAIMKGVPDITKASADGSIIDLTDLIDKYSVGLKALYDMYPAARAAARSPDGKFYSLPTINTVAANRTGHRNLWINKKWMDNLGITKMPTTLDEYLDVLRQFRDKDANGNGNPNDEIPYTVDFSSRRHPGIDPFIGSWGIAPNLGYQDASTGRDWAYIENGQVKMLAIANEYREMLQFMNIMWKEKLLDPGVFTQTTDMSLSKMDSRVTGGFSLSSADLWNATADDFAPLPPLKISANTSVIPVIGLNPEYSGAGAVITKADKNPEITMRWFDYFYSEEGAGFIGALSPLLEGVTCKKMSDGSWEYADPILNSPKGIAMALGDVAPMPGGVFPYWRNVNNSNYIYDKKIREAVPVYQSYYQKTPAYSYPVFSVQDTERVNDIRRDLDVYVSECRAKFITGELGFDKWNEYVATCERMNIRGLQAFFQAAYDRMK
jgi:putative aldouronate transport system substrate-binding protein